MNLLSPIIDCFHRATRIRTLRTSYCANLRASTSSIDERVRFHLEHIEEYWGRCLGFLQISPESVLSSDLFSCVSIGTAAAATDIRQYCEQKSAQPLLDAWLRYELQLGELRQRVQDACQRLESCASAFDSVREAYAAACTGIDRKPPF